jgi:hypothetical protein
VEGDTSRFFNKEERRRPGKELCGSKDKTERRRQQKEVEDALGKRWRSVKRVKYDLWALEPSEWLRGGRRKGGNGG